MRRDGKGVCEIARRIGRDKSTVSRELSRNSCARFYHASTAQRRYKSKSTHSSKVMESRLRRVCQ